MQKIRQMLPQRGLLRLHLNAAARGAVRQATVLAFSAAAVRGTLFGVVAPFGTALALGAAEETFLAAAAGAALGTLLWQSGGAAVAQLCVLAAVAVVRWVQPRRFLPASVGGGGTLGFLLLLLYSAGSLPWRACLRAEIVPQLAGVCNDIIADGVKSYDMYTPYPREMSEAALDMAADLAEKLAPLVMEGGAEALYRADSLLRAYRCSI